MCPQGQITRQESSVSGGGGGGDGGVTCSAAAAHQHGRQSGVRQPERDAVRNAGPRGGRGRCVVVAPVVRVVGRGVPDALVRGHRVQRDGAHRHRDHGQAAVAVRRAGVRAVPAMRHGRRGRPLHGDQRVDGRRRRQWRRWRCPVPRRGHRHGGPVHRRAGHVRRARVLQRARPARLRRAAAARRRHAVGRAFHVHVRDTHAHVTLYHAILSVQVRTPMTAV